MYGSIREQGFGTQQTPKNFFTRLKFLASLIKWMIDLIKLTEQDQEDAGIYLDRTGGRIIIGRRFLRRSQAVIMARQK